MTPVEKKSFLKLLNFPVMSTLSETMLGGFGRKKTNWECRKVKVRLHTGAEV